MSGNRATIGVDLLNADGGPRFGFARLFVEDLGGADADRFGLDVVAERDTLCPIERFPTTLVQPIEAGDIVVHDAVPVALPTVKAQCGRGGWAQYGFTSRGRCNQFVRLRPRTGTFPTDAAQCRSGGWVPFGFRSERTCVRFVGLIPR